MVQNFLDTGWFILREILNGIEDNIDEVIRSGVAIVEKMIATIGEEGPKLVTAGIEAVIDFINGVANGLRQKDQISRVVSAAQNLGSALLEGFAKGAAKTAMGLTPWGIGWNIAKKALAGIKGGQQSSSPSKLSGNLGTDFVDGYAGAMDAGTSKVSNSA